MRTSRRALLVGRVEILANLFCAFVLVFVHSVQEDVASDPTKVNLLYTTHK